jgi:sodium transport system permease protein
MSSRTRAVFGKEGAMSSRTRAVFGKEVVDNFRDRKAWTTAALFVVLGPLMQALVIGLGGRLAAREGTTPIDLPVVGAERAPGLVEYLEQRNIRVLPPPADPEGEVRSLARDAVLVIPASYPDEFLAGKPATVRLVHDSSQRESAGRLRCIKDALRGYSLMVGQLRLLARGVSPSVVSAVAVESADLSTPESRASFIFGVVPMFLLMALFAGGLYIAIDSTAGERERGTLEALLIHPVTPAEIILGKLGATAVFTSGTLLFTAVGFALVLNAVPVDIPDVRLGMGPEGFAKLLAVALPAVPLAAALQMLVASATRTFKEAQTATQFLMFLPALPGLAQTFGALKPAGWSVAIPLLGQHMLVERLLKNESIPATDFLVAGGVALGVAALLAAATIVRYDRKRVFFG